jgi:hypothetical protein
MTSLIALLMTSLIALLMTSLIALLMTSLIALIVEWVRRPSKRPCCSNATEWMIAVEMLPLGRPLSGP